MTLTLDEVRKTKFHMARRTGYEVSEVDLFVDRVEASFAQITEENQMLKQQVEALKQAQTQDQTRRREERPGPSAEELRRPGQPQQPQQAPEAARTPPAAQVSAGVQKVVVTTSADASPAVVRLVQLATEQSEQLVNEASAEAKRTLAEANQKANQITNDASTRAERLESESRSKAERLESESRSKAERLESESRTNAERMADEARGRTADLDRQLGLRRAEMFASLEQERDQLQAAVSQLRSFEANYRESFAGHLKQQLHAVENVSIEPSAKPALAGREEDPNTARRPQPASSGQGGQSSSTPRLDALLGESQRDN